VITYGKEFDRLKLITLQAVDCYFKRQPFTIEEINVCFYEIDSLFGRDEGSGFLNIVLDTLKDHGFTDASRDFGMAFVVTIAEAALHIEKEHSLYKKFGETPQ
jgi:hypothetical protein